MYRKGSRTGNIVLEIMSKEFLIQFLSRLLYVHSRQEEHYKLIVVKAFVKPWNNNEMSLRYDFIK